MIKLLTPLIHKINQYVACFLFQVATPFVATRPAIETIKMLFAH